jgi:hypothetical protein
MTGIRVLDGIRRQYSYGVYTAILEFFIECHNFLHWQLNPLAALDSNDD